jgi:antibiotic biosynthesis monooxygenase (ABM) superfamily enzyme
MLAWVIMPRLTALLYTWLYPESTPPPSRTRGQSKAA